MKQKQSALNDIILASIRDRPGQTIAKTIDTVLELVPVLQHRPSRDTIKRRIHELGARGHLYLRDEIIVHPRRETKPKEKAGNEDPTSMEEGSL
jgi:hypothetical protein